MGKVIEERRKFSDDRFEQLRKSLTQATEICADKACVYATGSFGRREASEHSDVDLFIVSLSDYDEEKKIDRSRLSHLKEILLVADLIRTSEKLGFPQFSGDGKFLQQHTATSLIRATGNPNDDAENTFTARLLLLLESKPLIGNDVYSKIIDDVIAKYWEEFKGNSDCFMPAYLANDILRYWRTLCLNYEANILENEPNRASKRRRDNYKLKHSRMLTCYSALLFLLCVYAENHTVSPPDVQTMVYLTPTQRVEWVAQHSHKEGISAIIQDILKQYERFLDITKVSKENLIQLFADENEAKRLKIERSRFGDLVYETLCLIGKGNEFYRRLVV
ncbi:MAG: nucleotidyltransferase domain-containing protein [Terracidiphilus sp.]|jgi:predicted nucleotidyltransferase